MELLLQNKKKKKKKMNWLLSVLLFCHQCVLTAARKTLPSQASSSFSLRLSFPTIPFPFSFLRLFLCFYSMYSIFSLIESMAAPLRSLSWIFTSRASPISGFHPGWGGWWCRGRPRYLFWCKVLMHLSQSVPAAVKFYCICKSLCTCIGNRISRCGF